MLIICFIDPIFFFSFSELGFCIPTHILLKTSFEEDDRDVGVKGICKQGKR